MTNPPFKLPEMQISMLKVNVKTGNEQHQENQMTRAEVTSRQPAGAAEKCYRHQPHRGPKCRTQVTAQKLRRGTRDILNH